MNQQARMLAVLVLLGFFNLPAQASVMLCSGSTCGEHFKSYSVYTKWPMKDAKPVSFENGVALDEPIRQLEKEVLVYKKDMNGELQQNPVETIKLLSKSDKNTCQVEHILNKNKKVFEYKDCENLRKLVKTKVEE